MAALSISNAYGRLFVTFPAYKPLDLHNWTKLPKFYPCFIKADATIRSLQIAMEGLCDFCSSSVTLNSSADVEE